MKQIIDQQFAFKGYIIISICSLSYSVTFKRKVTKEDPQKQKLDLMPGFRLTWHFSGLEEEEPAQYTESGLTQTFVRYKFINKE